MMDDPANLSPADRVALGPGRIAPDAVPSYPFALVDSDTETADIDAVVDFIRDLRGVDRIKLIGWSGGGIRTGTYALRHPEKVERLVIWASSNYVPDGPDGPPAERPVPGYPVLFQTRAVGEGERWRANITCPGQIEDEDIFDIVWHESAVTDPVGAGWGPGGIRGPGRTYWGWNDRGAGRLCLPTLVVVGEQDRLMASNVALFEALGAPHKAFLGIACASHFMMWERGRHVLRRAAQEWLEDGTLCGATTGTFRADAAGRIAPHPLPRLAPA